MKKIFFASAICLCLFEALKAYFLLPFPGSQQWDTVNFAYFMHSFRWVFRLPLGGILLYSFFKVSFDKKWIPRVSMLLVAYVIYFFNFDATADHMFLQPENLIMADTSENEVKMKRIVIGLELNGEARAYPVQYMGYHHQVQDTIGGVPVIVTYCTVCRSGRVFKALVKGRHETFRLVGMDHFNAMFEDKTTGSWWRQENGEAVTGKMKGELLPELLCTQTSLRTWLGLHPGSLIMQPDPDSDDQYEHMKRYESGRGRSKLTRSSRKSWKDKSWVVGVEVGKHSKAFDWNRLKKEKLIDDKVGKVPVLIVLLSDNKSFFAFRRPADSTRFELIDDLLHHGKEIYDLNGKGVNISSSLKPLPAYQEFWHSWKTFHPETER
jgi:hypothetical protein